jgi:hypothetical protein
MLIFFYDLTAPLVSVECHIKPAFEAGVLGKLWVCKLATLSGKVEAARANP